MPKFQCDKCNKEFSNKGNLNRHLRIYHEVILKKGHASIKCPECNQLIGTCVHLIQHLNRNHSHQLTCKHVSFKNENEFKDWKMNLEVRSSAEFVQNSGARKCGIRQITHYKCHRSGKYRSRGQNKRQVKNLGSNKINDVCTAFIRKIVTYRGGGDMKIEVDYCDTHSGHSMEAERLHLPINTKKLLAAKLAAGVSMEQILTEINKSKNKNRRDNFITRKELHNIVAAFNINNDKFEFDSVKVKNYMQSLINETESALPAVFLCKPKGEVLTSYPDIPSDEFVLAIMNDIQKCLFTILSTHCVLIHSVPEVESHANGVYLTTIIVRDENIKFYPVSYLISSSRSSAVLSAFFRELKSHLGSTELIKPSAFLSGDGPEFYMAWKSYFGEIEHNLISSWHASQVLDQLLSSVQEDSRSEIKRDFRFMQQEFNISTFNDLLDSNMHKWICCENTCEFGRQFQNNFASRKKEWAFCYNISAHTNANLVIPDWRTELESCGIVNGLVTKRFDKCVNALMTAFNNKIDKLNLNESNFRCSSRFLSTRQRHRASLSLNFCDIYEIIPKSKWLVPASPNDVNSDFGYYEVSVNETFYGCCNCQLKCSECNVCSHQFQCQCIDYVVRYQICEHVHLISRYCESSSVQFTTVEDVVDYLPLQKILEAVTEEAQIPTAEMSPFKSEMMRLIMNFKWMVGESVKCQSVAELQCLCAGIEKTMTQLENQRVTSNLGSYNVVLTHSEMKEEPLAANRRPLQRILPKQVESKVVDAENKAKEQPVFLVIGVH